jgi:hypothetical protein
MLVMAHLGPSLDGTRIIPKIGPESAKSNPHNSPVRRQGEAHGACQQHKPCDAGPISISTHWLVHGSDRPRAGLYEYTNANFLSRSAVFTEGFLPVDAHYLP